MVVDLEQLALDAAGGDDGALDQLLEQVHNNALARPAISRVLINLDEVDEAMQETLVAISTSIGSFRGDAAFTTWLFAVARNCAVAVLRRRRPTSQLHEHELGTSRVSSMIAQRVTIDEVLGMIPAKYAEAVFLRDVEGHSYAEIAERLGLSLSNTKSRIARGRAMAAPHLIGGR